MATPRHLLVDPNNECDYHLASRCVRRAFLCGLDPTTGRDYSHRRDWFVERIKQLTPCFAIDVYSYTVMSNHFHVVLRYDPIACRYWSDEEVVRRWIDAFPPTERGQIVEARKPELRELMLGDEERVACARGTLGSMSGFMKHLKQPIARRANVEDDCLGHFFEQRFYSGALLTEEALIAAMAYVDLNPIRAELAERIEAIEHTSIAERLQENSAEALAAYLRPVVSGLDAFEVDREASWSPEGGREVTSDEGASAPHISASIATATEPHADDDVRVEEHATAPAIAEETGSSDSQTARLPKHRPDAKPRHRRRPLPAITLAEYIEVVRRMAEAETRPRVEPANHITVWMARTKSLRKRQRAYGTQESLQQWSADRGLQLREVPLPA